MRAFGIAAIFARGGSKGIPGKNIRLFAGKPLIAWAIEAAYGSSYIDRVLVSTDDERIASVAREYGAEVPFMRPAELASDDAPEILAWRHTIDFISTEQKTDPFTFLAVIPVTSPLRTSSDIDRAIKHYYEFKESTDVVLTVVKAARSPYFNMVIREAEGTVRLVNPPTSPVFQRQLAPPVFDITTAAYIVKPKFVLQNDYLFAGNVRAIEVSVENGMDIDTPFDFDLSEYLMKKRLGMPL